MLELRANESGGNPQPEEALCSRGSRAPRARGARTTNAALRARAAREHAPVALRRDFIVSHRNPGHPARNRRAPRMERRVSPRLAESSGGKIHVRMRLI